MIDIHSHILPNIDDGSTSIENTLLMLKEAEKAGFTDIVVTPHYIENNVETNKAEILNGMEDVNKLIKDNNLNVRLYSGNEIYITPDISKKVIESKVSTLNQTRLALLELPMSTEILYAENECKQLINNGFIPVLAHPERYSFVQEDIHYVNHFCEMGVLLQCNYGSIIGWYGSEAKNTVKKLLEKNLVTFMGSDSHRPQTIYSDMGKILKKLKKFTNEEQFEQITKLNAEKYIFMNS